jgi:integral membrane sensor domain MASE1
MECPSRVFIGILVHCIRGQIAILCIPLQESLPFEATAHAGGIIEALTGAILVDDHERGRFGRRRRKQAQQQNR